ncbi:MAG: hypothetical protein AAF439_02570, partial [Pseudomonadota bacterium]
MRLAPIVAAAALLLTPLPAAALCSGLAVETVFACALKNSSREVHVCRLGDGSFLYSYGKPQTKPELELVRSRDQVKYDPWNGVGRYIWAYLSVENEGWRYQVGYSADRHEHTLEGYLNVFEPGADEPIVSRQCEPDTINHLLDDLDG